MQARAGLLVMAVVVACSSPPRAVGGADAGGEDASSVPPIPDADAPASSAQDFAFVANYQFGISAFAIAADGELVALPDSPFAAQVRFYALAVHPTQPVLYAADYAGHAVRAYQIAPDTGALVALGPPVALDHPAISIAVDPLARFVYVGDFDDADLTHHSLHVLAIDATGALASLAASSLPRANEVTAIAAERSGHVVYLTDVGQGIHAFSVDAGGTLAELTSSPFAATTVRGGWLAAHPTESIVYTARLALAGFAIEPTTGALSALSGSPFAAGPNVDPGEIGVAIDPRGRFVCVVDSATGMLTVYALASDGSVALPGTSYSAGSAAYSVSIAPDGRFVYVATDFGNVAEFAVDPTSFALTSLAHSPLVSAVGGQPELVTWRAPAR